MVLRDFGKIFLITKKSDIINTYCNNTNNNTINHVYFTDNKLYQPPYQPPSQRPLIPMIIWDQNILQYIISKK
jgi:hypothetical protein